MLGASIVMGGQALYLALLTLPMLGYSVYGLVTYVQERRRYPSLLQQRRVEFGVALTRTHLQIEQLREQQRSALLRVHPGWQECLARVQRRDPRLWERTPPDADFLDVRIGLGTRPAVYVVDANDAGGRAGETRFDDLTLQLRQQAEDATRVEASPVTIPLPMLGVVGVAGSRALTENVLRAAVLQIATHHSPDDVTLMVLFPAVSRATWDWVRWLPHTWDEQRERRYVGCTPEGVERVCRDVAELLQRRTRQVADSATPTTHLGGPAIVIIFADPELWGAAAPEWVSQLRRQLTGQGPRVRMYPIFVHDLVEALPRECAATLDAHDLSATLRLHRHPVGDEILRLAIDQVATSDVERFARACAPIRLADPQRPDSTVLPARVTLMDLFGVPDPDRLDVVRHWRESSPFVSLSVPIGFGTGNRPLQFDLHDVTDRSPHAGGPNALIAGTVGSGKSELVLSLVAALAVQFHPHEVVFALLDFKGGATSDAVRELPHVVSTLTDLELDEVPRALVALQAELEQRENLFRTASQRLGITVNHIDTYLREFRRGRLTDPLPYLVLIVDEFVVLKQALPDQMDRFVNIAIKGRALGIRMILAAQKPAGAIGDQIRANTRSRICLRVAQAEDSQEMIGRSDAASLTGVGRAYLRIGEDEVFELFQAAWSGAPIVSRAAEPALVSEVDLDGTRRPIARVTSISEAPTGDDAQTQLQALVDHLRQQADKHQILKLRGPWLPLLPDSVAYDMVRDSGGWDGTKWDTTERWLAPVIGIVDEPHRQRQVACSIPLQVAGNLLIVGAPGSGKTTLLQTLVVALAHDHNPADVQFYVWDGGEQLRSLEALPHVGGVLRPRESERMARLWWMLRQQLTRRADLMANAGARDWAALKRADPSAPAALVVAIDGYQALAAVAEDIAESIPTFAQRCAGVGIHLVMTSSGQLPYRLLGSFREKIALELVDASGYSDLVGDTRVDTHSSARLVPRRGVPGRGLVANPPREFQTALAAAPSGMADAWIASGGRPAEQVAIAPDQLPLAPLISPGRVPDRAEAGVPPATLGLQLDSLEPLCVSLSEGPHFLVTGEHRSGKSTALQTWLLSLLASRSPHHLQLYLVDFGGSTGLSPLRTLPSIVYIEDDEHLATVVDEIRHLLAERRSARDRLRRERAGLLDDEEFLRAYPPLVMAIDDADQLESAAPGQVSALEALLRQHRALGLHVLLAGATGDIASAYGGLIGAIKSGQTGLLVGSGDDAGILNLRLPRAESERALAPGRGYYVRKGYLPRPVQVASAHFGETAFADLMERIRTHS
jgi:S-DNA-T family DNA segregation ATPase FtsK/SpoIIIE